MRVSGLVTLLLCLSLPSLAQAPFFEPLARLPGGTFTRATAVSADGSTVVGYGDSDWVSQLQFEAFRWTRAGGMVGMRGLPGGVNDSEAHGVSADGSVIVGSSNTGGLPGGAFRWTEETGMVNLGIIPGRSDRSGAADVSADGSIVVGSAFGLGEGIGFIWDDQHGMRSLQDVLENEYGLDLNGWRIERITGISADGRTFIGDTGSRSWVAHIPEPATLWLLLLGALALARRR